VNPDSILGQDLTNPFHHFLRENDVYEGNDGELYVQADDGKWFQYLNERDLEDARPR
jgi:hypothetical protein